MLLLYKLKKKVERLKLFYSDIKPILLSHHPNCEKFDHHVYHIKRYKLCIGCFTYYPTIIITIILSIIFIDLNLFNLIILNFLAYAFFTPVILNLLNLTRYMVLKIISKISIGIGTGFYIISILLIPIPIILKILLLLQLNFIIGVIGYIRANGTKDTCLACEYRADWARCPGMQEIIGNLYKHGFKKKKNPEIIKEK